MCIQRVSTLGKHARNKYSVHKYVVLMSQSVLQALKREEGTLTVFSWSEWRQCDWSKWTSRVPDSKLNYADRPVEELLFCYLTAKTQTTGGFSKLMNKITIHSCLLLVPHHHFIYIFMRLYWAITSHSLHTKDFLCIFSKYFFKQHLTSHHLQVALQIEIQVREGNRKTTII